MLDGKRKARGLYPVSQPSLCLGRGGCNVRKGEGLGVSERGMVGRGGQAWSVRKNSVGTRADPMGICDPPDTIQKPTTRMGVDL